MKASQIFLSVAMASSAVASPARRHRCGSHPVSSTASVYPTESSVYSAESSIYSAESSVYPTESSAYPTESSVYSEQSATTTGTELTTTETGTHTQTATVTDDEVFTAYTTVTVTITPPAYTEPTPAGFEPINPTQAPIPRRSFRASWLYARQNETSPFPLNNGTFSLPPLPTGATTTVLPEESTATTASEEPTAPVFSEEAATTTTVSEDPTGPVFSEEATATTLTPVETTLTPVETTLTPVETTMTPVETTSTPVETTSAPAMTTATVTRFTSTVTSTITSTVYAPTPTVYAACAADNYLSEYQNSPIGTVQTPASVQTFPGVESAEDCCTACMKEPTCGISYFDDTNASCFGSTQGELDRCDASQEIAYFNVQETDAFYTISNGRCGQWYFDELSE
ncbi:uncharacterized protein B0I36DRAFT_368469 [Microdochium trichocladiopsis]|uniref:Apple domain-containing protein n=1 Tax=Microdochium trichocladiopsis TaxID=1682393 RepID=A0A9P8XXU9_9PEZI|nr:uncharacterized protein B0I36DRAFT_368469 [Microdochium trichocladiopsis]KAH7018448.1 hypothetical protein B0I36DRAFT_368469 [Microdochium trichocladiopsis]